MLFGCRLFGHCIQAACKKYKSCVKKSISMPFKPLDSLNRSLPKADVCIKVAAAGACFIKVACGILLVRPPHPSVDSELGDVSMAGTGDAGFRLVFIAPQVL